MSQFIEMFGILCDSVKTFLSDFVSLKAGKNKKSEVIKDVFTDCSYPCYGGNGIRGYVEDYTHSGIYCIIGRQGAQCGNVQIAKGEFYATEHAVVVTPMTDINPIWLFYALTQMNLNQYAHGAAQPGLAVNQLEKLPFSLPGIVSQTQFALIADQADKSKFADFKSQFIEMFGNPVTNTKSWSTAKIKDVAPEVPSKQQLSGKVWLLNLDMIESNTGHVIEKVYEDVENALSVQAFDEGNVLFSKLRPYLNKVIIPDDSGLATTELVPLRPEQSKLHKVFLSHLLRGDQFVNYANDIAGGTKMPRMPLSELRNFKCILPPIDKQLQFVAIAEQADKSKSHVHIAMIEIELHCNII